MRATQLFPIALLLGSLSLTACGAAGFESPSKVKGLRVLALQKDEPYAPEGDPAAPNDDLVHLQLLYWDAKGSATNPRKIEFNFFRCVDPPGDLYYNCFNQLDPTAISEEPGSGGGPGAEAGADDADVPEAGSDGGIEASDDGSVPASDGDHVVRRRVVIPPNVIHDKAPGITRYGLVYVLFTACAGHLGPVTGAGPGDLPFGCFDDANRQLGPEDFVPGYSSIYVYDTLRNANPIITDFHFREMSFASSFAAADADVPHVPRCTEGDRAKCPNYPLQMAIDRQSAEVDPDAKDANGAPLKEQLWITFYATGGDFTNTIRLVNDASQGWNDDNGTQFRAPAEAGPVRIWGVVHDNRGGVAWGEGKVIVD